MLHNSISPTPSSTVDLDHCEHADQALRRRVYSDGRLHFVMQCQACGAQARSIKHAEAMRAGGADAPAWDDQLQSAYWERRVAERKVVWTEQRSRWRQDYDAYLLSDDWRAKRNQRLRFDKFQCQARLDDCREDATEVHHLTYRHLGNEPLFDIVSVCGPCHRAISVMDGSIGPEDGR